MKVKAGSRTIEVTNPDKVLFPEDGYTKADLVTYYEAVAPVMLPHVKDRPATMERYPDGIAAHMFFNKEAPKYFPEWIARVKMPKKGGSVNHVVIDSAATLVYLAQQGCITPHIGLHRIDDLAHPDQVMFDLDPSTEDFSIVRKTALTLRELLEELGLFSVVKTSGSRGLHIVVPLDRSHDFEFVKRFAHDLANLLALRDPDRLTIEFSKEDRGTRLFVDWMRNNFAQTAVAPYGVRARDGAPVAVPLDWSEVEDKKLDPRAWSIKTAPGRIDGVPDPWKGWRRRAKGLTRARSRLDRLHDDVS